MSILELRNVEKIYGEKDNQVKALRNINLKVEEGEFVAIVGTSGSGKSTCLNLIGGLDNPTSGQIFIKNKEIGSLSRKDCGKHINRKYIEELLRELGIWEKRKKYPNELSGGQQQRVAIARALANKPSILLCDEPTGNLDSATTIEVMGLLKTSCRKYNQTILMVTHNEAIAQTCDRVIHIEDGQIVTGKRRFPAKGGDVVC